MPEGTPLRRNSSTNFPGLRQTLEASTSATADKQSCQTSSSLDQLRLQATPQGFTSTALLNGTSIQAVATASVFMCQAGDGGGHETSRPGTPAVDFTLTVLTSAAVEESLPPCGSHNSQGIPAVNYDSVDTLGQPGP
jgi:hypothetical protein